MVTYVDNPRRISPELCVHSTMSLIAFENMPVTDE